MRYFNYSSFKRKRSEEKQNPFDIYCKFLSVNILNNKRNEIKMQKHNCITFAIKRNNES